MAVCRACESYSIDVIRNFANAWTSALLTKDRCRWQSIERREGSPTVPDRMNRPLLLLHNDVHNQHAGFAIALHVRQRLRSYTHVKYDKASLRQLLSYVIDAGIVIENDACLARGAASTGSVNSVPINLDIADIFKLITRKPTESQSIVGEAIRQVSSTFQSEGHSENLISEHESDHEIRVKVRWKSGEPEAISATEERAVLSVGSGSRSALAPFQRQPPLVRPKKVLYILRKSPLTLRLGHQAFIQTTRSPTLISIIQHYETHEPLARECML